MVRGPGSLSLCFASDLNGNQHLVSYAIQSINAYPRRTPSTCRSTHQMPAMPKKIHRYPFLMPDPSGNQLKNVTQKNSAVIMHGTRKTKSAMWNGRAIPEGCDGTGKKGAMPDPRQTQVRHCLDHLLDVKKYLYP